MDEQKRFDNVPDAIQYGPIYPCNVCHRTCVRKGLLKLTAQYFSKLESKCSGIYEKAVDENVFLNNQQYLCHTCNRWLMYKQKVPPLSVRHGITIENVPSELELFELCVNSKNIIFIKIFKLPKSRWSALKDKIVNVPVVDDDILKTLSELGTLPRLPGQAGLIPVQLKRKISYKGAVQEACIDPQRLIAAAVKLKELEHPGYTMINLKTENYLSHFDAFLSEYEESNTCDAYSDQHSDSTTAEQMSENVNHNPNHGDTLQKNCRQ